MQTCFFNGRASVFSGSRSLKMCLLGSLLIPLLSGCTTSAAGPSAGAVNRAESHPEVVNADIKIIDLTDSVARRVMSSSRGATFADGLGDGVPIGMKIGRGDVLDVAIWEAPPAALFGSTGGDATLSVSSNSVARGTTLPEQMVDSNGRISIPFVGSIQAAGQTPQEIERDIVRRLTGKAHDPQVSVRLIRNVATNATIVGDVNANVLYPLTSKGERLLDALASAGGVKQPVGKTTIQVTRAGKVMSMPMETVIRDPRQNIRLQADDVVTVLFQPYSFTALGATGANAEVPFEATGITLAQALGRVGGLQDNRADVKGVFLFRLEDMSALDLTNAGPIRTTPDGKVPVIYRIDLKNPATFFVAQGFPIRNGDTLYVSNAPLADIQKFVNIVASLVYPILSIQNTLSNN
ncbi:polysaccharide export protein [Sphingobium phenoxybenzoativorans]|uniref:Polysaccharide export protein n=1 Tax=Sphingobium phenoxybenzoativorans TaxID=1592790 RepID=A0A975K3T2_9SPHN|nr:polysaccharide biosynthesis/export family protein [Sphingobium phenoxybenzoativorans]QUT04350.1 polysaccharide export protein [Sphingobium phenoxybenzoativorans]